MIPVRFSKAAERDIEDIADFIALDAPLRALSFIKDIRVLIQKIGHMPTAYPARFDLFPNLRACLFHDYIAFFIVQEEEVLVLRILHGARDIGPDDFQKA